MSIQIYFQAFSLLLSVLTGIILIVAPTVIGLILLRRTGSRGAPSQSNSITRLDQLEENDSIIVEDVNIALEQIIGRLDKIEEVLEKEGSVVKGFRK